MSAVLALPQVKDFLKTLAKGKEKRQEQGKEYDVNAHAITEEGEPSKKPWDEDILELSSPSYSPPTSFFYSSDSSSSSNPRRRISGYHNRTIFSVDWSKTTGFIATAAGDDCIRIFSEDSSDKTTLDSGPPTYKMLLRKEKAHSTDVNCVRWHPQESSLLASAGDDSTVKVWRVEYENL
ncbi:hypothetical protein L7F22_054997 [Adiantum nelumboides]|nr:hypothetical protein [Adiantum nelumboides]